jgi:hypothetical protein
MNRDNFPAADHEANRDAAGLSNKQQTIEKQQS